MAISLKRMKLPFIKTDIFDLGGNVFIFGWGGPGVLPY